jgi:protein-disulfide isomerase
MRPQQALVSTLLVMCLALFSCSNPVKADTRAAVKLDPQLEQQILEVIRKHPEAILESVEKYQQQEQEKLRTGRQVILQKMQASPQSVIGTSPTIGAKSGKPVLFEFSDFQCPYCASARLNLKQFVDKHPQDVTLVYKHFPLTSIHANALPAAQAAWAAQQQGKFWPFHDGLFDGQKQIGETFYPELAKKLGLDVVKFEKDRRSPAAAAAVQADMALGQSLGINGTPFFIFNGQAFSGAVPVEELEARLAQVKQGK